MTGYPKIDHYGFSPRTDTRSRVPKTSQAEGPYRSAEGWSEALILLPLFLLLFFFCPFLPKRRMSSPQTT
jgi:hypothetical protein